MTFTEERLDEIFALAEEQSDYIIALHSDVIPDFDRVTAVRGFVRAGEELSKEIMRRAMEWDRKHAPKAMKGGAWMNYGFSTADNEDLGNWEAVPPDDIDIIYKD